MREITIRCAQETDYPKFHKLHKRFAYLESNSIRNTTTVDEATFKEYVQRESLFVAFDSANQMVGYAVVDAYEDKTCDIQEIFVAPEHQRKGYGEQIVQFIKDVAKNDGIEKLCVFSIFIQTDNFWRWRCRFKEEEGGELVYVIN